MVLLLLFIHLSIIFCLMSSNSVSMVTEDAVIASPVTLSRRNQTPNIDQYHPSLDDDRVRSWNRSLAMAVREEESSGLLHLLPIRAQIVTSPENANFAALQQIAMHFGMFLPLISLRRIAEKERIQWNGSGDDLEDLTVLLKRLGLIFHKSMARDGEDLVRFSSYEIMQKHPVLTKVLSSTSSSPPSSAPLASSYASSSTTSSLWIPVVGYHIRSVKEYKDREDVRKALYRRAVPQARSITRHNRKKGERNRGRDRWRHRNPPRYLVRRGMPSIDSSQERSEEKSKRKVDPWSPHRQLQDIFTLQAQKRLSPSKSKTYAERERARRRRERQRGFFSRLFGSGRFETEKRVQRRRIESNRVELLVNYATEDGEMYYDAAYRRYNTMRAESLMEELMMSSVGEGGRSQSSLQDQPRVLRLRSPEVCEEKIQQQDPGAICLPRPLPPSSGRGGEEWEGPPRSRPQEDGQLRGSLENKLVEAWKAEGWPVVAITGRVDSFSFWGNEWQGVGWGRETASHREHEKLELLRYQHYEHSTGNEHNSNNNDDNKKRQPWISIVANEPITRTRGAISVRLRLHALEAGSRYKVIAIRGNGLEYKERKVERTREWGREKEESFWGTNKYEIKDNRWKVWEGQARRATIEVDDPTPLSSVHSQIYFVRKA